MPNAKAIIQAAHLTSKLTLQEQQKELEIISDLKIIKKDIAELKELLKPQSSIILTGAPVTEHYLRLNHRK